MKPSKVIKALTATLVCLSVTNCKYQPRNVSAGSQQGTTKTGTEFIGGSSGSDSTGGRGASAPQLGHSGDSDRRGTISGGGSYSSESGMYLLNQAKADIVSRLRATQKPIFKQWPEGWSAERMADVIDKVRTTRLEGEQRDDDKLMFDNHFNPHSGEAYIVAKEMFFDAYASVAINHLDMVNYQQHVQEIRLKLVHEVLHLMGVGLGGVEDDRSNSRVLAKKIIHILEEDVVRCHTDSDEMSDWVRMAGTSSGSFHESRGETAISNFLDRDFLLSPACLAPELGLSPDYDQQKLKEYQQGVMSGKYQPKMEFDNDINTPDELVYRELEISLFPAKRLAKTDLYNPEKDPSYSFYNSIELSKLYVENRIDDEFKSFVRRVDGITRIGYIDIAYKNEIDPRFQGLGVVLAGGFFGWKFDENDGFEDKSTFRSNLKDMTMNLVSVDISYDLNSREAGKTVYKTDKYRYKYGLNIKNLEETIELDTANNRGTLTINQEATLFCGDSTEVINIDNLVVPLVCETPNPALIDINDYL